MKDFIHKSLLNAGSKDAVSNMLQGAALGAGANTALGAVQGDFDIVGNATAGALLGTGGGAAMRHMGDKYSSAIANMRKQGMEGSDSFSINHFTHAIKEEADFMGNPEMMKRAQSLMPAGGKPAATASDAPEGGKINTGEASNAEKFRDRPGYVTDGDSVHKATGKTKDVQMPTFNTFDAFGRKTSQDGGTMSMDMHRSVSPTEQATTLRADELRQEKKAASFADAAKNPVQMNNSLDPSYKPKNVKDLTGDTTKQKIADAEAARRMSQAQARNMSEPAHDKSKSPVTQAQRDRLQAKKTADTVAKQTQTQTAKDAQVAAGDLIAGIFKETGRGPIKKPTTGFEGGTLGMGKKPIDSSNFKPIYKNGDYQHPQHMKVKKYQPEKK